MQKVYWRKFASDEPKNMMRFSQDGLFSLRNNVKLDAVFTKTIIQGSLYGTLRVETVSGVHSIFRAKIKKFVTSVEYLAKQISCRGIVTQLWTGKTLVARAGNTFGARKL
jgi:hypothetical protein